MPLRLVITTYHKLTPGQRAEVELDRGELKIGRSAGNDWVLPDPERLVSSQHCVIQYRDGIYYITDTSTNGVILQNAGTRLRRGSSEPLDDGEVLKIGEYEIRVQIGGPTVATAPVATVAADDPFNSFEALMSRSAQPVDIPPPQATPTPPPAPRRDSPFDTKPDLFDFLSPPASVAPAIPDHLPAQQHEFRPPPATAPAPGVETPPQTPASVIPADWDPFADLRVGSAPPATAIPDPFAAPAQAPAADRPAVEIPALETLAEAPHDRPLVEQAPMAEPAPAPAPAPASAQPVADDALLLEAFLRGAGLQELRLDRAAAAAQMESIGRSYRLMVEGLIDVLRARASLKGEFRMAQTMIQPIQNNPLKFAPNVDEALLLLLRHDNQAFMAPDQAVSEGFDDLRAHQLALMAGVQAAIKYLLARFEPSVLEGRLNRPSGLSALLPNGRRAHYWELFTELYATISQEAEDGFQELFGREFSRAYEEHIARLRGR
ncbi:type VI secretion system-associated FHA domain protein TagH [Phytopseudomonas dryadis]|uniref:Type VI secretion system-associated FHA domain protein TagH n=1 Tax=Phytopseudomonas dryadis TaxID=2487520 RepID=A0ABY1Z0X7_9GAMM|nr:MULTISPECIES: type VI secretion system-associated FHA domain protein TagH [Pseudomonas]TBV01101.1 type VI secretion system-associated FHA domain protein TagH [Pseudomonas dryadis]TBV13811.1 type VI secretion system-associated FHA domain protein TagH [Pseudomonas sp. FRB 230]